MAYETTDQLMSLLSHHWYKRPDGNLYKLFDVFNNNINQISDASEKVIKWRAIQDAEGTTLDLFGQDIKTYRPTKDDPPYRFLIHLKMLLARAQGTRPSIVKITGTALGTFDGIKIWNTKTPRHVGIAIPYDYVSAWPVEKFLLDNMQNMLALGYWLDEIVFYTHTKLPFYVGMGTQIKHRQIERSPVKWWTGWKAKTSDKQYIGIATQIKHRNTLSSNAKWWTGWKAESVRSQFIGVVGQLARSSVWATTAVWSKPQTAEIHAGLTIGNKTLTTTTQSIATEQFFYTRKEQKNGRRS